MTLICSIAGTSPKTQATMNLDEEATMVCKSKRFLPMNLSNPKEEFFDIEGIGCIGEARLRAAGLKEKLVGGFS